MSFEKIKKARARDVYNSEIDAWRRSVPGSLRGFDLDGLMENNWNGRISKMASKKFQDYVKHPSMFLLLHGASGLGKTVMGILVIDKFISSGRVDSALYIDTPTLLYEVSYGEKRQENMIHKVSRPDILLIDDIGAGGTTRLTDIRKDALWRIVNNRWLDGKYTIMTTNLPVMQLDYKDTTPTVQNWFGQASWDRIAHDVVAINFQGHSMRRRGH